MDAVSNFIGSISPEMFGGGTKGASQNLDLGDTTFSDLLEKQLNNIQGNEPDFSQGFGLPSGINIADIGGGFSQLNINTTNIKSGENMDMLESVKPINSSENTEFMNLNNKRDLSTSEVVTFFTSLFDSKPSMTDTESSGLFDFERKTAANLYNKYAKNIVTDLSEFVTDAFKKS